MWYLVHVRKGQVLTSKECYKEFFTEVREIGRVTLSFISSEKCRLVGGGKVSAKFFLICSAAAFKYLLF